jgi:hypothetical protein
MSDTEPEPKKPKRQQTPAQMEGLRKAMAAVKAKREALAKQKEEVITKIEKGELPKDTPIPKEKRKSYKTMELKPIPKPPAEPEPTVQALKKPRKPHVSKVAQQFDAFKQEMLQMVQKPAEVKTEVVEKIVEKPVERVIQKERVVSGSELLNKIFNL